MKVPSRYSQVIGRLICFLLFSGLPAVLLGQNPTARPQTDATAAITTVSRTDPHLIGWWQFEESTGATVSDASAGGHIGQLEGGLAFESHSVPGRIGKALRFDGKEACVRISGFKGVTGGQPRTVVAWIKTKSTEGEIVSWGDNAAGKKWMFGHIRGHLGVSPHGGYLYMKAATDDDAWHQVAVVVREASPPNLHDHVALYKDGTPAEIDDIGLLDLWPIDTGNQGEVRIGRQFKGAIDDVRIYDRALSEDEIHALFEQGKERKADEPKS